MTRHLVPYLQDLEAMIEGFKSGVKQKASIVDMFI